MKSRRPVIGIAADRRIFGHHAFHLAGEKYLTAIADAAGGIPVLLPALGDSDIEQVLERLDGIVLPGSPSNVEPHHYSGSPSVQGTLHDSARDAMTLPLIPRAVAMGVPLLGICRGFQEMNVAFGGSLLQRVHEVAGHLDHREDESADLAIQYGPAHEVRFMPGGMLRTLAGADQIRVNSLHWQGVDQLGKDLIVEARAPDGLIEGFQGA
ncbi:MAG: gamma-glutamyl-gamma-aminobutyrate hydrolase family protein [Steroidobacteraceae bacterium]